MSLSTSGLPSSRMIEDFEHWYLEGPFIPNLDRAEYALKIIEQCGKDKERAENNKCIVEDKVRKIVDKLLPEEKEKFAKILQEKGIII